MLFRGLFSLDATTSDQIESIEQRLLTWLDQNEEEGQRKSFADSLTEAVTQLNGLKVIVKLWGHPGLARLDTWLGRFLPNPIWNILAGRPSMVKQLANQ